MHPYIYHVYIYPIGVCVHSVFIFYIFSDVIYVYIYLISDDMQYF